MLQNNEIETEVQEKDPEPIVISGAFEQYPDACVYKGRNYASRTDVGIINRDGAWYLAIMPKRNAVYCGDRKIGSNEE